MLNLLVILALPVIGIYNLSVHAAMSSHISRLKLDSKTGIMKGAEPVYIPGKNRKAILLIHGYIGSPTDYGRLPQLLAAEGCTISVPLLPGHGRNPREFSKTTPQELMDFVSAEYEKLAASHDEVTVVGFSMGGALATLVAEKYAVENLVLLAPYFAIPHQWYYGFTAEDYSKQLTPFMGYFYRPRRFKQVNDHSRIAEMVDYNFVSTQGSKAAIELGNKARQAGPSLKSRTLLIHSRRDKATDYRVSKEISGKMTRLEKFVTLEKSNHMILWDYDFREVENEILNFVRIRAQRS